MIVSNVSTAKAAADMLLGGLPLTERIVTVTGAVKNPGNFLVPVGTSAKELIQLCGGVTVSENRVIAGGPMTGPCVANNWNGETELFHVTKNTSGILILPEPGFEEQPCIRCSGCEACALQDLFHIRLNLLFLTKTMISVKSFMQVNVLPAAAVPISALQDVSFPCVPAQPEIS